jgi:dUTP pyrophosphatase
MPKLLVELVDSSSLLPRSAHPGDSGLDLYSAEAVLLHVSERRAIRTGIRIKLPEGTEGQIRPRSGLALQHGLTVLNAPGTIDSGFRGELQVILINLGGRPFEVTVGMRIAQLVICPVTMVEVEQTTSLPSTSRGPFGFGSSED